MEKIKVEYDGYFGCITSEVYAVDPTREKFLIVDRSGYFKWVSCSDCQLYGWTEEDY